MSVAVAQIQGTFIREAQAAPTLFTDLAKVELYIAESYRTRAFIELLQNADDAGAKRFQIRMDGSRVIVANDGRPFAGSDVEALCRSGASNKRRGTGTIGYRGIGFKSVVGIASEIDVVSGAHAFRFSRTLTQQVLATDHDVPLVRVPHPLDSSVPEVILARELMAAGDLTTVFVLSGLDLRALANEVEEFTDEALLFLNTVNQVQIQLPGVSRSLLRSAQEGEHGCSIERLDDGQKKSDWLIAAGTAEGCEKLAFLLDGKTIVPVSRLKAVIHAFLPTSEFSGASLKMNGDFSTDPSRKTIDMDSLSTATFSACVQILAQLLKKALVADTLTGVFSTLLLDGPNDGRFRKLLHDSLTACFDRDGFPLSNNRSAKLSEIRLAPDWLGYPECEVLCARVLPTLPSAWVSSHPHLPEVLRWLGARPLTIQEALDLTKQSAPAPITCAQLLCRAAKHFRFELNDQRASWLAGLQLLPRTTGAHLAPTNYRGEQLAKEFTDFLAQTADPDDLHFLLRKLKLPESLLGPKKVRASELVAEQRHAHVAVAEGSGPFRTTPAIEKWRSAEKNAAAWFSALKDVLNVKDVSQANVGYDLEVMFRDGKRNYVEVKSVKRMGEPIRLTNNEHATGYQHGESYVLAVVVNSEPFEIRLIKDPIRSIVFDKRCEQWSWYSEGY